MKVSGETACISAGGAEGEMCVNSQAEGPILDETPESSPWRDTEEAIPFLQV